MKNIDMMLRLFPNDIDIEFCKKTPQEVTNGFGEKVKKLLELPEVIKEKAVEFYDNFRQPEALITYLTKIKTMPKTKKIFQDFVSNSIKGTFFENRYKLINRDTHLWQIFSKKPNLLREWKRGEKIQKNLTVCNINKTYSVEDADNPQDMFLIWNRG